MIDQMETPACAPSQSGVIGADVAALSTGSIVPLLDSQGRRWGWPIVTEMRASRNRFENVCYGVYRIDDGVEIGEREQAHIDACQKARGGEL